MDIMALGIDQGLANLGYGIIKLTLDENFIESDIKLIKSGTINTSSKDDIQVRLLEIHNMITNLSLQYNANVIGCEKLIFNPFQKGERNKSASIMITNMVSGIIFLIAGERNIFVKDFIPGTVKKHVAGNGRATKEDVIKSVENFCAKEGINPGTDHEADAIAIGITIARYYVKEELPFVIATKIIDQAVVSKEEKDLVYAMKLINALDNEKRRALLLKKVEEIVTNVVIETEASKVDIDIIHATALVELLPIGRKKNALLKKLLKLSSKPKRKNTKKESAIHE